MRKIHFALSILVCGFARAPAQNFVPPTLESFSDARGVPTPVRAWPQLIVSTPFGTSYQVNVNAAGQNIVGDAANEPSMCMDPNNPRRLAIGWRQFGTVTSSFRQAGWGYSTNGGVNWTFGGLLETNVFRSDPVLTSDASGNFYYLSLQPNPQFHNDLWKSTNGGMNWQKLGEAVGGDKAWMVIDTTSVAGRNNIYQSWSPAANPYTNRIFSRSLDLGANWQNPLSIPQIPFWGTLDTGRNGELYLIGWDGAAFWFNRSINATNRTASPTFDLTTQVDLGGSLLFTSNPINPDGLLGQPWIAVDRSSGPTRGNLYALCTVTGTGNPANVMLARSTNGGSSWSAPIRINDDSPIQNAWHWFGTLSVAPNGRVDVCWNDTRSNPNNNISELYYSYSEDGGVSWVTNRAISPPFNHTLGYPVQRKIGDYMQMISLDDAACIAYAATFNDEEDIYFVRVEQPPILVAVERIGNKMQLSWNATSGRNYCVQVKNDLNVPWSVSTNLACLTATNTVVTAEDQIVSSSGQRFYRVVKQQ